MKVVLLASSASTKLLPLTQTTPKTMLPIVNAPLALHVVRHLQRSGFTDLTFCVNHEEAGELQKILGNGDAWDATIRYSVEKQPLGTAGALGQLTTELAGDSFLVMGSNLLFNFDLQDLVQEHQRTRAAATVLISKLTGVHDHDYGEAVELSADGSLNKVLRGEGLNQKFHFFPMGIYCFDPVIFNSYRPGETFLDIKEQLLPRLREAGLNVSAHELAGHWRYINTIEDYLKMNWEVLTGELNATPFMKQVHPQIWAGNNVHVAKGTTIKPPVIIGDNTVVHEGAQIIGPTAIGADCIIGKNVVLQESVVWNHGTLAEDSAIQHTVMMEDAHVDTGRHIQDAVVVGHKLQPVAVNLLKKRFKIDTIAFSSSNLFAKSRRQFYEAAKRVKDLVMALTLIILFFPLLLLVALAIKLESPGPIVFRQKRCGLYGHEFNMLKFRSMLPNADHLQEQLRKMNEQDGPIFKIENDPRLTRVGKFIRKTSLDELPQLFNILKGEMSFVGPRPLARKELRYQPEWVETRLQVKPGLTGLWQVNGRSNTSFSNWVKMDTQYVLNQNFLLDLKILVMTPLNVIFGAGAC